KIGMAEDAITFVGTGKTRHCQDYLVPENSWMPMRFALGSIDPTQRLIREPSPPRSFNALALAYFSSANYRALAPGSQSIYRRTLGPFLSNHGHRRADQMKREHVIALIGAMAERPGAANMLLKRLRTLLRFGMDLGWIKEDPTT